ncbi:MAG: DUF362 domain-containing protein [Myxococcales bacterium]|nr:DUF362 domain-containing protein [Myxococcales bacterium]
MIPRPSGCVAIRRVAAARYPAPDLALDDPSAPAEPLYSAVFAVLRDAGLDLENAHTPGWSPFSKFVAPGGRVLVLVNFVHHRLGARESLDDFASKCTQAAVLRPLLVLLARAVGPSGTILFGNSPVQGADWPSLLEDTGARALLASLGDSLNGTRVEAVDLRGWVLSQGARGSGTARGEGVGVDLGAHSLLERTSGNHDYRVLQYDPQMTARFHGPGRHEYRLSPRVLDADLVLSVPKLKTHVKVGVTAALKGCVGAIAEKDCLAHHRAGSPDEGGDEFPAWHPLLRVSSALGERVWRRGGDPRVMGLGRTAERLVYKLSSKLGVLSGGSWHGNDTCWRMTLDIARCILYADRAGVLHPTPQRKHITLIDGVLGGEGDGPLRPRAVASRCLVFADDCFAADVAACAVMGFDPRKIGLFRGAVDVAPYPVTPLGFHDISPRLDGAPVAWTELPGQVCRRFEVPTGWRGAMEFVRG